MDKEPQQQNKKCLLHPYSHVLCVSLSQLWRTVHCGIFSLYSLEEPLRVTTESPIILCDRDTAKGHQCPLHRSQVFSFVYKKARLIFYPMQKDKHDSSWHISWDYILVYSPSQRSTVWNISVLVTPYASAALRNWDTCSICLKAIGELWILFTGLSPSWRLLMSSPRTWDTSKRLWSGHSAVVKKNHNGVIQ